MEVAHHLAAELHDAAVGDLGLLDPAARPVARLEHDHVAAGPVQVTARRQPGQAGAHHHDVGHVSPFGPVWA